MLNNVGSVLDLTQPLYHNCPALALPLPPQVVLVQNPADHGWTLEKLEMTTHQGTHMDAPYHLEGLSCTIDQIPPGRLYGPAVFVDLRKKQPQEEIGVEDLIKYSDEIKPGVIVCLVTGWCHKRAWTREWRYDAPWLSAAAAGWLAGRDIRGVGIDQISIGGMSKENESTHRTLLKANIWIVEDLMFPDAVFGIKWDIIALPLLIRGASGAPCRVIAVSANTD